MNRPAFRPWFVMALIFLLGIATGSLLTIGLGPRFMTPPGAQEMKNRWMMHLIHRLNLTADQQAKIQPIIADAETQIQSTHRDDVSRISGIIQAANNNISKVLTSDQQEELKKLESERERTFSGHMRGPGMHRPDGGNHHPPPDLPPPATSTNIP
jgi:hypothetical protein